MNNAVEAETRPRLTMNYGVKSASRHGVRVDDARDGRRASRHGWHPCPLGTFFVLQRGRAAWHDEAMITFEAFVEIIGEDFAKQYTPAQLHQLHADVQQFAQIVIAIHRAKTTGKTKASPQGRLDGTKVDRTLKKNPRSP